MRSKEQLRERADVAVLPHFVGVMVGEREEGIWVLKRSARRRRG